jgi:hypothetical protein
MSGANYRGIVKDGAIILADDSPMMPDGTEVIVTPVVQPYDVGGAILAALEAGPRVSAEDVLELERAIEAGRRPRAKIDPFPETPSE